MRPGPRGIASQFTCAFVTPGKPASSIATTPAVHCFMSPPNLRSTFLPSAEAAGLDITRPDPADRSPHRLHRITSTRKCRQRAKIAPDGNTADGDEPSKRKPGKHVVSVHKGITVTLHLVRSVRISGYSFLGEHHSVVRITGAADYAFRLRSKRFGGQVGYSAPRDLPVMQNRARDRGRALVRGQRRA